MGSDLELVEIDFGEMSTDVGSVACINILPSSAHAFYLAGIGKVA